MKSEIEGKTNALAKNKKPLKAIKVFFTSYTSTIAVLGATAGGFMIGRLPDNLFGRGVITTEWLVFVPFILLAEGLWILSYFHDRSRSKNLSCQKVYSAAIIIVSIILAFGNYLSPYYSRG